MRNERAISEIMQIYGIVSSDKQLALDVAIKALSQEPCIDAVSREAVKEIINDIRDCISIEGYCAILERLKKLPSVTQKLGNRKCSKCVNANNPIVCSWNTKDIAEEIGCDFWQDSGAKMESEDKE